MAVIAKDTPPGAHQPEPEREPIRRPDRGVVEVGIEDFRPGVPVVGPRRAPRKQAPR